MPVPFFITHAAVLFPPPKQRKSRDSLSTPRHSPPTGSSASIVTIDAPRSTTMPRSPLSRSSTVASSTMFMNWSKPRRVPDTTRPALRETEKRGVGIVRRVVPPCLPFLPHLPHAQHGQAAATHAGRAWRSIGGRQPPWRAKQPAPSPHPPSPPPPPPPHLPSLLSPFNRLSMKPFSSGGATLDMVRRCV